MILTKFQVVVPPSLFNVDAMAFSNALGSKTNAMPIVPPHLHNVI